MNEKVGKKNRSAGYPLLPLPDAIEIAKKIFDNLGSGPHSRDVLARGMGYISFSGAASGKVGALVHFGLLSRLAGRYSVTGLAQNIFSDPLEARGFHISQAAVRPELYRALIARFSGEILPKDLATILASDYRITIKAASAAAQNFFKTIEFAGLAKDGRIVEFEETNVRHAPIPDLAPAEIYDNDLSAETKIKIKLPSGIEIAFPERLAYKISMGEFAPDLKKIDEKATNDDAV